MNILPLVLNDLTGYFLSLYLPTNIQGSLKNKYSNTEHSEYHALEERL